jgi:tetratricopeptide (TPR) repeat protein
MKINGDIIRWRSHRHGVPIERAKLEERVAAISALNYLYCPRNCSRNRSPELRPRNGYSFIVGVIGKGQRLMSWRDILIGSIVTLIVTILGGVGVYYFTQENKVAEKLSYQVDKQISFIGKDFQTALGSVKFSNTGDNTAYKVSALVEVPTSEIKEFNVTNENNASLNIKISPDKKSAAIHLKELHPNEIIAFTYLLNGKSEVLFNIRSSKSIGVEGSVYQAQKNKAKEINDFAVIFIPIIFTVTGFFLFFLYRRRGLIIRSESCKNNVGFVLLHNGLLSEANDILRNAVESGEDGGYSLSNYSVALAYSGEMESALKFIDAAKSLSQGLAMKALNEFNLGLIEYKLGNVDNAKKSFEKAISLDKSQIRKYLINSSLVDDILANSDEIKKVIDGL